MISQQVTMFQQGTTSPCSNKEQTPSSPATSNSLRGAEQSGNIAKQRFARTRWVRSLVHNMGGMISKWQVSQHRHSKRASNQQAKIEVISSVWSSCLRSRKEEERVHEEDKRAQSNGSSQLGNKTEANERSNPERSRQHGKQPSHKHRMMHNQA